jgi:uncharacterized protein DUF1707/cell wall-active antibiotic response 4TMS protein YvqF
MADAPLLPTLARAREQKVSELSQHFANDDLSLDELERRIERVYKAGNVSELEAITSDLRAPAAVPASMSVPSGPPMATPEFASSNLPSRSTRILAVMSESKRKGRWLVPPRVDVVALMADMKIDLTSAVMPPGGAEFHVRSVWAACKIIVPPGMRVVNEMHAVMASVVSKAEEMDSAGSVRGPILRLTGTALMAEVKVVVRRREDALAAIDSDDEDED